MTAMEKAIAAATHELGIHEMVLTDPLTLRRLQAKRVVRAVLMAVREVEHPLMLTMDKRFNDRLDRILNEGQT